MRAALSGDPDNCSTLTRYQPLQPFQSASSARRDCCTLQAETYLFLLGKVDTIGDDHHRRVTRGKAMADGDFIIRRPRHEASIGSQVIAELLNQSDSMSAELADLSRLGR